MKLILGLAVIAAAIYFGVEFVPPYYENYQFTDFVKNEATLETYTAKPEADIKETIFKKAQELDVPIARDAIKVQRAGVGATGSLSIQAPYVVHMDLPGYPVDLHFDASTNNKSPF
jgi:hypothetical protein